MFEMYETINYEDLIKGERYFIRYSKNNKSKWIIGTFFDHYGHTNQLVIFGKLTKNTRLHYGGVTEKFHKKSLFYKIITFKQYREKLIEKFQQTALKVILKKIVNEYFEW